MSSSSCVIVLVFSLAHLSQCWIIPKELEGFGDILLKNCTEKVKLSQDVVLKARNGTFPKPGTSDEKSFKCYLLCTFQITHTLKDDTTIDVENAIKQFPENLRAQHESSFKACATEKGADDCDTAFKMQKCLQREDGENYFML